MADSKYDEAAVLVGAVIAAVGASINSYPCLVSGEVIVGLGTVTIEAAEAKIFTYLFEGNHLALIYGINIGVQRLINGEQRLLT